MMAHAQKPDFIFRAKRTSPCKSAGGRQFSRLLAAEVCGISSSNAGYTMFRGSVKGTGYPLHSPVSPSHPLPCVIMCHHISTGVYRSILRTLYTNSLQNYSHRCRCLIRTNGKIFKQRRSQYPNINMHKKIALSNS